MTTGSPEGEYFAHLCAGRLMLQRSRSSGAWVHPPRIAAPGSGAIDLEWTPVCGRGTVHASTLVRMKPPAADYNVVLVDLDEGPRLLSRVDGLGAVPIGLRVEARIVDGQGSPVLVFVPAQAAQ